MFLAVPTSRMVYTRKIGIDHHFPSKVDMVGELES